MAGRLEIAIPAQQHVTIDVCGHGALTRSCMASAERHRCRPLGRLMKNGDRAVLSPRVARRRVF
jgi:hypothetical protein